MISKRLPALLAALMGAGLALSISAANVAWVTLGALWMGGLLKDPSKRRWRWTGLELPIGCTLLWSLAGLDFRAQPGSVFRQFKPELLLLFFFVVSQSLEESTAKTALQAFFVASLAAGGLALLQSCLGMTWDPTTGRRSVPALLTPLEGLPQKAFRYLSLRDGRALGTRSHPLTFAECLMPAYFLFLGKALEGARGITRWKGLFQAGVAGAAILLSESRGVWVGVAAGTLLLAFSLPGRRTGLVALLALALAVAFATAIPGKRSRLVSIFRNAGAPPSDRSSKSVRVDLWGAALSSVLSHPVRGEGTNNFRVSLPEGEGPAKSPTRWSEAHNIYLQAAAERGLVGLALFVWVLARIGRLYVRAPPPWSSGLKGTFAAFLVAGMTESWFNDDEVTMTFLFLGALPLLMTPSPEQPTGTPPGGEERACP